ncbi:hypothetical protein BJ508DRAFT_335833 [Ascobolus immersus RN42]|uniref:Uncharacterized protein n=1 Tax=Ascobolus immersus RN42 TaxID=1160509 RepID=A0A3N4HAU6_ASCIM|nr:hypothetical protein BJ508DRAFT_335833 [Ascobolus immersus RN42]
MSDRTAEEEEAPLEDPSDTLNSKDLNKILDKALESTKDAEYRDWIQELQDLIRDEDQITRDVENRDAYYYNPETIKELVESFCNVIKSGDRESAKEAWGSTHDFILAELANDNQQVQDKPLYEISPEGTMQGGVRATESKVLAVVDSKNVAVKDQANGEADATTGLVGTTITGSAAGYTTEELEKIRIDPKVTLNSEHLNAMLDEAFSNIKDQDCKKYRGILKALLTEVDEKTLDPSQRTTEWNPEALEADIKALCDRAKTAGSLADLALDTRTKMYNFGKERVLVYVKSKTDIPLLKATTSMPESNLLQAALDELDRHREQLLRLERMGLKLKEAAEDTAVTDLSYRTSTKDDAAAHVKAMDREVQEFAKGYVESLDAVKLSESVYDFADKFTTQGSRWFFASGDTKRKIVSNEFDVMNRYNKN